LIHGDLINATLRTGSIVFLAYNCYAIYRDKRIAGVSIYPTMYAGCVAMWSAAYYASLDQWRSSWVLGAHGVVELTWVGMVVFYLLRRHHYRRVEYQIRKADHGNEPHS
jgi:hypothetical protein